MIIKWDLIANLLLIHLGPNGYGGGSGTDGEKIIELRLLGMINDD